MKIGFSGTRNGMTPEQRSAFIAAISATWPTEFHHGACVGSDEEAAIAVWGYVQPDYRVIVAHPGCSAKNGDQSFQSQPAMNVSDIVRPEATHFARNRNIVNETDILIACPPCKPLPESGGTSYTVGYARKVGKPVHVIWPGGSVDIQ